MMYRVIPIAVCLLALTSTSHALPVSTSRDFNFAMDFEQTTMSKPTTTIDYDLADFDEYGNDPGIYDVAGSPDAINLADDTDQGFVNKLDFDTGQSLFEYGFTVTASVSKSPIKGGGISDEFSENSRTGSEGGPSDEGTNPYSNNLQVANIIPPENNTNYNVYEQVNKNNQNENEDDIIIGSSGQIKQSYQGSQVKSNDEVSSELSGNDKDVNNNFPKQNNQSESGAGSYTKTRVNSNEDMNKDNHHGIGSFNAGSYYTENTDEETANDLAELLDSPGFKGELSQGHSSSPKKNGGSTERTDPQLPLDTNLKSPDENWSPTASGDENGSQSTSAGPGSPETSDETGSVSTSDENSFGSTSDDSGSQSTSDENGSHATSDENGSLSTSDENGSWATSNENGSPETSDEQGSLSTSDENGSQSTLGENLSQSTSYEKGSTEISYKKSSLSASDEIKSQPTSDENGSQSTSDENGSQSTSDENGSQSTSDENGSPSTSDQNTSQSTTDEIGSQSTSDENGSQSASDENGSHSTSDENGSASDQNEMHSFSKDNSLNTSLFDTTERFSMDYDKDFDYDIDDEESDLAQESNKTDTKAAADHDHSTESYDLAMCFSSTVEDNKYCPLLRSLYSICKLQFKQECAISDADSISSIGAVSSNLKSSSLPDTSTSSDSFEDLYLDTLDSISSGEYFGRSSKTSSMSVEAIENLSTSFERSRSIFDVISIIKEACSSICALAENAPLGDTNQNVREDDESKGRDGESSESSDDVNDLNEADTKAVVDSDEDLDDQSTSTKSSSDYPIKKNSNEQLVDNSFTSSDYEDSISSTDSSGGISFEYASENTSDQSK